MCGRFTIARRDGNMLAAELGVEADSFVDYRPRYNVAPTQMHYVVRVKFEDREVLPARWGLVNTWANDASTAAKNINARAETVNTRPTFREAFMKRRCVVPADGFFEGTGQKKARQPTWSNREDNQWMFFAGLYESGPPKRDQGKTTFRILTTDATALTRQYHDR